MEPSAVIPNYEQVFALKEQVRGVPQRPSNLTLSSVSLMGRSPEPSPTRSRFKEDIGVGTSLPAIPTPGSFTFVGPEKTRFHSDRDKAPYPLPCGLDELSRYIIQ
jgi:hypothetical protein